MFKIGKNSTQNPDRPIEPDVGQIGLRILFEQRHLLGEKVI